MSFVHLYCVLQLTSYQHIQSKSVESHSDWIFKVVSSPLSVWKKTIAFSVCIFFKVSTKLGFQKKLEHLLAHFILSDHHLDVMEKKKLLQIWPSFILLIKSALLQAVMNMLFLNLP